VSLRKLCLAFIAGALLQIPASATNLFINPTYDSTITNDPNSAAIIAGIQAAINQIQSNFADAITVNIIFQEGGGLGASSTAVFQTSYSSYRTALLADSKTADDTTALATLPNQATSPVDGNANMWLTAANLDALGIAHGAVSSNGTITLNTSIMNLNRTTIDPSKYDLQAVTEHEIDEVLGLGSGLNLPVSFPRLSRPQDLFRYSASGVRSYTTSAAAVSYFSINGGVTNLVNFNQSNSGDFGDWAGSATIRVQDAFGTPGSIPIYGVEIRNLDVIGFDAISAVPEPGTFALAAVLLLGGAALRKRIS